jgi:hypothetical protein
MAAPNLMENDDFPDFDGVASVFVPPSPTN